MTSCTRTLRTCVSPNGYFRWGLHKPSYVVTNLRERDGHATLGTTLQGAVVGNARNFPDGDVHVREAAVIYEIPNAFAFRGATFIDSSRADAKARDPNAIRLPRQGDVSLTKALQEWAGSGATQDGCHALFEHLPEPVLLALAATSTDPEDLKRLARLSCALLFDSHRGQPTGLRYETDHRGRMRAVIHRHDLFEAVANNPSLPDDYKEAMVLRPGVQGDSEIVGDVHADASQLHIFEYLRRNSYIPWGHFAANMAHDSVRYAVGDLTSEDIHGLRHLYYQRTYVRMAESLGLTILRRKRLEQEELESLRLQVLSRLREARAAGRALDFTGTLWGWNFGFDFAPSGYRLHASHQQVHQQYALIPARIACAGTVCGKEEDMSAYACGDLVAEAVSRYRAETGQGLFEDCLRAIRSNTRTDGRAGQSSLVVHEDDHVILFVPKAQASGWELQLMPLRRVGHVLEADASCRRALDKAMLLAQQALEVLGARMVTGIEHSRRFDATDTDQRLLYSFLPKLPYAPGGFSEAQLRCIVGHYPEDFAQACRMALTEKT